MTYPLHSCFGVTVAVWRGPFRERGVEVIVVELPDGRRQRVPLAWTSERPVLPCVVHRGRLVLFRVEELLRACAWCDEKRPKRPERNQRLRSRSE
jgi:hypothetical protein